MYKIKKEGKTIGRISLREFRSEIKLFLKKEEENDSLAEKLKADLKKMKVKKAQAEEGQGKENPANPGWKENVMEELNALGYELEEDHSGEIQVKMEIPMDQFGRVLADYHPTCPEQAVSKEQRLLHEDIVRTMFPKIQNGSREKLKVLAGQIKDCVEKDDDERLEELLNIQQIYADVLLAGQDPGIPFIEALYLIDAERISEEKRTALRRMRLVWGVRYREKRIIQDAEALLAGAEGEERFQCNLAIGCAYSWDHKYTAAIQVFQDLMGCCDQVSPGPQGWLYYDLAQVYYLKQDYEKGISLFMQAGDIWSSGGETNQAAWAYQNMIYGLDKLDSDQALAFARDQAEHLLTAQNNQWSLSRKEMLANWLYGKAQLCYKKDEMEEAIASLDACAACAENIAGLEDLAVRALECQKSMLQEAGRADGNIEEINRKIEYLKSYIKDPKSLLKIRMQEFLSRKEHGEEEWTQLEREVKNTRDPQIQAAFLGMQVARYLPDNPNKALACLDEAWELEIGDEAKAAVLNLYALVMAEKGDEQQEYRYLFQSLPYLHRGILQNPRRLWELGKRYGTSRERLEILQKMKECLPGIKGADLCIAQELAEQGRNKEALQLLNELKKAEKEKEVPDKEQEKALEELFDQVIMRLSEPAEEREQTAPKRTGKPEYIPEFARSFSGEQILDIRKRLEKLLLGFKEEVEKQHVAGFWKSEERKKTWVSHPEKRAQELLLMYLRCSLNEDVAVLEEVTVDQGRLDILLCIPPSIKAVIELKMCGCGYSSAYTRHAVSQTAEYMEKVKAHIGFVLVMDGRSKDQGTGLEDSFRENGKEIRVILVNVSPKNPSK